MRERTIIRNAARERGYLQDHKDARKEDLPLVRDRKTDKSILNLVRRLERDLDNENKTVFAHKDEEA